MKTKHLTMAAVFLCTVFGACIKENKQTTSSRDDHPASDTTTLQSRDTADYFKALINENKWAAASVFGDMEGGKIRINANTANGFNIMTFRLPGNITAGNYDLNRLQTYTILYRPNDGIPYAVQSGVIMITAHDTLKNLLKAKFIFQAVNSDKITQGAFSLTYVK